MTRTLRSVGAALIAFAALLPGSAAMADDNSAFGEHVVHCAQSVAFSGTHNPGMHQGASGWSGMTCEP
ncbi:MAG TPA: hypothetical protein VF227_12295 [Actinomycetes bacterium]